MSEFNINVEGGSSVRLPTAGKYCDRDIIVTASGGGGTEEIENIIDQSGVLGTTDETVTEKVEQLVDKAEWEKVWYEQTEIMTTATRLFEKYQGRLLPRTNFISATTLESCFLDSPNLESVYYINCKKCNNFKYSFLRCSALKTIGGLNLSGSNIILTQTFHSCTSLETIESPLDFSNVTVINQTFQGCRALKNIRFIPESIKISLPMGYCVALTAESIQSIIDGLAYVDSTQNLTLSNKIVLTDNQKQVINAKGWTLIQ